MEVDPSLQIARKAGDTLMADAHSPTNQREEGVRARMFMPQAPKYHANRTGFRSSSRGGHFATRPRRGIFYLDHDRHCYPRTTGERGGRITQTENLSYDDEDNRPHTPREQQRNFQPDGWTAPDYYARWPVGRSSLCAEDSRKQLSDLQRGRTLFQYEEPVERPSSPPPTDFLNYSDVQYEELLKEYVEAKKEGRWQRRIEPSGLSSYTREETQARRKRWEAAQSRRINDRLREADRSWNEELRLVQRLWCKSLHRFRRRLQEPEYESRARAAEARDTSHWDANKGPQQLGHDKYEGPGPTREVEDQLDILVMDEALPEGRHNRTRGGGNRNSYGGGGFNRKRRFREDEDDHRGDQRDHHRPRRQRYEEPIASNLRRMITLIGEDALINVEDVAAGYGRDIANNFEDDQVRGPLMDMLVNLIVEQPLKIPYVAAVIHFANDINGDVAGELVERASRKMRDAVEEGKWRDFKLLLRFYACLQDILEGAGVFQILNQMFDWVIDLQSASPEDALSLELTKIILLTIPYAIAASPASKEQVSEILEKTELVATEAAANHPLSVLVDPYPNDGEEKPFGYQSVVEMLQRQLREEEGNGWEFKCIPRVYHPIVQAAVDGENGVKQPRKHTLPPQTIPVAVDVTKKPLFPESFFSIFDDQDIRTVPQQTDISLGLIRDVIVDTINILDYNRIAAANFLIALDQFWAPGTFATRGITLDQLRNYPADRSTWKPEDMMIDAVFSQLLVLPSAQHKLVFYHGVIFEACKIAPSQVAPTLGRAIRWLFQHVEDMDMELMYRFLDWFAHHLSNFEFRWKWTEWVDELERSNLSAKKAWMIAALDKEIRLSFAKRIRDTLPEVYHSLLTEGKFKDVPEFKYSDAKTPFASEGKEIYQLMKGKEPEAAIQPYIDAIQEQAAEHSLDPVLASTDAYVTAMCFSGAKSVSHILSAIERSKDRLLQTGQASTAVRKQIVQSVVSYWNDQPGNAVNIVDKLLNYTIVTPDSVIAWALGPESLGNGAVLAQAWRYEMVSMTINKVATRVRQIVHAKVEAVVEGETRNVPEEQMKEHLDQVDNALVAERESMRRLFANIDDAVSGVAAGAADGLLESDSLTPEDLELVKGWGGRWARVFRRRLAVEEAHVGEVAVETQVASGKEQAALAAGRTKRKEEEERIRREKEDEIRAERIRKEEEESKKREEEKAAREAAKEKANGNGNAVGENGDVVMDGADAGAAADDGLDVAE